MSGAALPFNRRRAGILLHPTSLPGGPGNGDLGSDAYRFVDWLAAAGISVWQTLPHGPTHADRSPYQCLSVHAGNPLWINLEALRAHGWLEAGVDGSRAERLRQAGRGFRVRASAAERADYDAFVARHGHWLDDFALYDALRAEHAGRSWLEWPPAERDREPAALAAARGRLADGIAQARFEQYLFFRQWRALKQYANERGVLLFGDMPIFVAHDSAEVWAQREYFVVDAQGQAQAVAGVPPDYFSATGQRWGNPLYRWERMAGDGFRWWVDRLRTQFELYDLVRIDHFRGFEACWEIPAQAETAAAGRWVQAPGEVLFAALRKEFGVLPLVAEDLGVITPEVDALRHRFGLPGMKVLQFAFEGGADNPYLPHNHEVLSVVYTGTHDNNTTLGWFEALADGERAHVLDYLAQPSVPMPWPLIHACVGSVARLAVVPMQDVLGLGAADRMNTPSTRRGNWQWRFGWDQVPEDLASRLRHLVRLYGREGGPHR